MAEAEKVKLKDILNRSKRLRNADQWKEESRDTYKTSMTVEKAKLRLEEWLSKAQAVYKDGITTIRNHLDGICNYFINRRTSNAMEGINNRIKSVKHKLMALSTSITFAHGY